LTHLETNFSLVSVMLSCQFHFSKH